MAQQQPPQASLLRAAPTCGSTVPSQPLRARASTARAQAAPAAESQAPVPVLLLGSPQANFAPDAVWRAKLAYLLELCEGGLPRLVWQRLSLLGAGWAGWAPRRAGWQGPWPLCEALLREES